MGLTGDFQKLSNLTRGLERFQNSAMLAVKKQIGTAALELVRECFDESKDPFGATWRALTVRQGKPLLDTRRLYSSIGLVSRPLGFIIQTRVNYAAAHNFGRARVSGRAPKFSRKRSIVVRQANELLPKRQFMPGPNVIPRRWERELREIAEATLKRSAP